MLRLTVCAACLLVLGMALGCGDDQNSKPSRPSPDGGTAEGDAGAFYPQIEATDPCSVAGYYFDGESDCDVVRCPELECECPPEDGDERSAASLPVVTVTLSGCVPEVGCLSLADCARICDPSLELTQKACQSRIAAAGSLSCENDADCVTGACREESVGKVCIDVLGCAEDGHCGAGSACLYDPGTLDSETAFPTALGRCSNGEADSACFEADDCVFGRCSSGVCTSGDEGEACQFNDQCASGFCRIAESATSGTCVSGAQGADCYDDGDCESDLHCTGNVCASAAIGQLCDTDDQCESGACVAGRCRGGEPGSRCEEAGDCESGFCVGFVCTSGQAHAPCSETTDCQAGLTCARQSCSDGTEGSPCEVDADCNVFACVNRVCSDGRLGAICEAQDECRSGICANPAGVEPGECTDGQPGSRCTTGSQCQSGTCTAGTCN